MSDLYNNHFSYFPPQSLARRPSLEEEVERAFEYLQSGEFKAYPTLPKPPKKKR